MKVCVSASGPRLDDHIDPRFGRCQYFIFLDTETMDFESIPNASMALGGGAGIQAAQFVANKGAKVVLTGQVGPKAYDVLVAAGIEIVTGASGTVKEIVERYKRGEFRGTTMPSGPGPGMGMNPGMGIGRGMGRGIGRCWGGGVGTYASKEEIEMLRRQSQTMKEQLEQMRKRIEELEKERKGGNK
ncbi:MAG TPA: dinitrogenase iron-molybdenum cofactor biosynthesis protein [Syntrophaceae bacterium]|nr:dinitrogenase iron-molybdenum cofactor biosynthesis protein [Syntrophaceae bacterium]